MILKAEHVSKTIKKAQILKDINLELNSGTVYGFTGRNGSGKTMLFRALSGLMRLTEGAGPRWMARRWAGTSPSCQAWE